MSESSLSEGTYKLLKAMAEARGCSLDQVVFDGLQMLLECGQARFGLPKNVADLPFNGDETAVVDALCDAPPESKAMVLTHPTGGLLTPEA